MFSEHLGWQAGKSENHKKAMMGEKGSHIGGNKMKELLAADERQSQSRVRTGEF